ncbi:MAG: hypothetical protein DI587_03635 [Variovorax paradoxus]|nr:MAG: hypothetical protein DI583_03635 [Variovorax paradoxus]PZQ15167.1 MAG: hypothetical protein DI587_03635 [Variovorax paradoxus]HVR54935.1 hypothetical protein [Pseudorhodoferax sp.]
MTFAALRARPRRISVLAEEERAWVSFYQRAGHQPAIAAEVLAQLDLDPEMKREHLALYLCCRETLRQQEARALRDERIGAAVRWLVAGIFVRLPQAIRRAFGRGGDVALACLLPPQAEPAATKVRRLATDPAVRAARAAFKATASASAVAPAAVTAVASTADTAPAPAVRAAG